MMAFWFKWLMSRLKEILLTKASNQFIQIVLKMYMLINRFMSIVKFLNLINKMPIIIFKLKFFEMLLMKCLRINMKMFRIFRKKEQELNLKQWKELQIKFTEDNNNHLSKTKMVCILKKGQNIHMLMFMIFKIQKVKWARKKLSNHIQKILTRICFHFLNH